MSLRLDVCIKIDYMYWYFDISWCIHQPSMSMLLPSEGKNTWWVDIIIRRRNSSTRWSAGHLGGTNVWYVWSIATELIHWHVGTRHNDIHSQQQRFCWTLSRFHLLQYIYIYIYIYISCWVPNVTLLTHWGLRALGSRSPTFHLGKACSKVWVVKLWSNGCGDYRNNFSAKASRPTITS